MIRQPLTATERSRLLAARETALREHHAAMERIAQLPPGGDQEIAILAAAEEHLRAAELAEEAYFDRLPRVVMGCCPFDAKPLVRTFDPYGFDGPWWRPEALPGELPSCPHFCAVLGAASTGGDNPHDVPGDRSRPATPYVVPRLLNQPGMVAVLSRIEMTAGNSAVAVAYFAPRRPPAQDLAANWPRSVYLYTTALGQHRWRLDDAERDFDLRPWLARGKLRWCEPGSNNERLSFDPPDRCPYIPPAEQSASAAAHCDYQPG